MYVFKRKKKDIILLDDTLTFQKKCYNSVRVYVLFLFYKISILQKFADEFKDPK